MKLEQRRLLRRFTPAMWWTLGDVVHCDRVRDVDLSTAHALVRHGFLKDIVPRPDGGATAMVTGAGLQAWRERYGRLVRQGKMWVSP
jgi:hypothetical protein